MTLADGFIIFLLLLLVWQNIVKMYNDRKQSDSILEGLIVIHKTMDANATREKLQNETIIKTLENIANNVGNICSVEELDKN